VEFIVRQAGIKNPLSAFSDDVLDGDKQTDLGIP
jgi:hypothetical protein